MSWHQCGCQNQAPVALVTARVAALGIRRTQMQVTFDSAAGYGAGM